MVYNPECVILFIQKELFKSAMEVDEDCEKSEGDVSTPTNPNVCQAFCLFVCLFVCSFLNSPHRKN